MRRITEGLPFLMPQKFEHLATSIIISMFSDFWSYPTKNRICSNWLMALGSAHRLGQPPNFEIWKQMLLRWRRWKFRKASFLALLVPIGGFPIRSFHSVVRMKRIRVDLSFNQNLHSAQCHLRPINHSSPSKAKVYKIVKQSFSVLA